LSIFFVTFILLISLMGCINSKSPSYTVKSSTWAPTSTGISLNGVDLEKTINTKVAEFPFYSKRLREINWETISKSDKPFEDPNFLADVSSIFEDSLPMRDGIENWASYVWKRPSEIYGEGNFSLYNKIDPNDIKQGECGDCYYLSSLSSLAENPDRIK